jgi:hypothetical protein
MYEGYNYADIKDIVERHERWKATNDRIKDIESNAPDLISPELLSAFDAMVEYMNNNEEER